MKHIVCEKFCVFYKPEKTGMKCGTVEFLERNFTKREIKFFSERARTVSEPAPFDQEIKAMVCETSCEFYKTDDCDFRLGKKSSSPCGGYSILSSLIK